jgi:predicted ATPase
MRNGVYDTEVIEIFAFLLGAEGRNPGLSNSDPQLIREKARRAVFLTLEAICRNGPVILIVEDIHWIDPSSQDLLAEAIRFVHQLPILLLMTTRPNSSSEDLATSEATRISLRRLEQNETRRAIESKWPGNRLETLPELIEIAEQVSGGVPLLIEQICQWISENADVKKVKMARTASSTNVSTFETIMDARLHRLGSARDVARAGAVAGNRFTLPLLCALLPNFGERSLREALETLCDAGFLSRVRLPGTSAYGFRHALIQETIYNAQLRRQRRVLHRRLFSTVIQERDTAPWIDTGQLADHAERAGLLEDAVGLFVAAGKESSSVSAMVEARHYLEHALQLCDQLNDNSPGELLRLTALTALGPVLTGTVGHNSPEARKLYEDAVAIARLQRIEDQSKWFPIYWGWWLSGSDFHVMRDRAIQVQRMLADVDDPEIKLQVNHCIWAIEYNVGRHRETQEAIANGLRLYNEELAKTSRTLFGGHDAKVCGLGQLGLSLWLTGQQQASDDAISEMMRHADNISHAPSKAHAFDIAAVSAFFRNDVTRLGALTKSMGEFARQHEMKSLEGQSLLFGGWVLAQTKNLTSGHEMFGNGLSLLKRVGAVVDLPLYLDMHAVLLGLNGIVEEALEVVDEAIGKALQTGHAYWLAELHRRRALLLNELGRSTDEVAAELRSAKAIAKAQGATALLKRAALTIQELGVPTSLDLSTD